MELAVREQVPLSRPTCSMHVVHLEMIQEAAPPSGAPARCSLVQQSSFREKPS